MFELSRFIVRNDSLIKDYQASTESDVIEQFPTRNFTEITSAGNSIQYLMPSPGETAALSDDTYAFLTDKQKYELYRNHVLSYLLEAYIDVMTGNQTSEKCFDIIEPASMGSNEFVSSLVNYCANHLNDTYTMTNTMTTTTENSHVFFAPTSTTKVLASNAANRTVKLSPQNAHEYSSGIAGLDSFSALKTNIQGSPVAERLLTTQSALSNVTVGTSDTAIHTLAIINEYSRMFTSMSDANNFARRTIQPKQFDRVFNVLIDSNAFDIDIAKTEKTIHGKQALDLLVKAEDVVTINEMTTSRSLVNNNVQRMRFRKRNTFEGDLLMDKYIVTIEVVEGKVV
jgi:hypothetical protein